METRKPTWRNRADEKPRDHVLPPGLLPSPVGSLAPPRAHCFYTPPSGCSLVPLLLSSDTDAYAFGPQIRDRLFVRRKTRASRD